MNPNRLIYLDNAATTQVAPEVCDVVLSCMREDYGNPASAHSLGNTADRRVADARASLLSAIGDAEGRLGDIIWTSGGTEGDAMGILGAGRGNTAAGRKLVLSAVEHSAVRESAALLEGDGFEVVTVPVSSAGAVDPERFADACRGAAVAALMLVNNEIGVMQPVAEVAATLRRISPATHLHCDAVQALGKVDIDVAALDVDSLAVAAHKLHGPKGIGGLWLRRSRPLAPLWGGGGHQGGLRSGTLNVPGIAGFGVAIELASRHADELRTRFSGFAQVLLSRARATGIDVAVNGEGELRAPHVLSLAFRGVSASQLMGILESHGLMVSAGSACSERDRRPSPVLAAIGLDPDRGAIRFSFGRFTTDDDIARAGDILASALERFA